MTTSVRCADMHVNLWSARALVLALRFVRRHGRQGKWRGHWLSVVIMRARPAACPTLAVLKIEIISHLVMYCTVLLSFM